MHSIAAICACVCVCMSSCVSAIFVCTCTLPSSQVIMFKSNHAAVYCSHLTVPVLVFWHRSSSPLWFIAPSHTLSFPMVKECERMWLTHIANRGDQMALWAPPPSAAPSIVELFDLLDPGASVRCKMLLQASDSNTQHPRTKQANGDHITGKIEKYWHWEYTSIMSVCVGLLYTFKCVYACGCL